MKKRLFFIILMSLSLQLVVSTSVLAFSDIKDSRSEQEILALKEKGIVNGVGQDRFLPEKSLTYAEAVQLLVKACKLNINDLKFIKAPSTSDYYKQIKDDQWYSQAFIVAHLNGLTIPNNIQANDSLTKAKFTQLLFEGLSTKGQLSFTEARIDMLDQNEINQDQMSSIQKLLNAGIIELDNGYFHPNQELTRSEAAKWIYQALAFTETKNLLQ